MIMLSHHAIQDHPYVVTLEGICWDIPRDGDQVWPVLVFEKSIHGDLFQFVKAGRGSALSIQEKLKLCTDIGIAIRDMHSNSIYFPLYIEVNLIIILQILSMEISSTKMFLSSKMRTTASLQRWQTLVSRLGSKAKITRFSSQDHDHGIPRSTIDEISPLKGPKE
jgi:hypothetical protein